MCASISLVQSFSRVQLFSFSFSFSFSISPSNEYSGLISFRMDWLDLLSVQEDSQESSPIPQRHHFIGTQLSL